jgi:hypothetical protein
MKTRDDGLRVWCIRTQRVATELIFKQHRGRHSFAISPRDPREFYLEFLSSEIRGRRECRALDAPAAARVG